jgi:penicillin-insensitive murein endopeptidase
VLKAEQLLHQPRDSANHDDHIHLRIACTAEEKIAGCSGGGPAWPWLARALDDADSENVISWDDDSK